MFQESEIISLILSLTGYYLLWHLLQNYRTKSALALFAGYSAICLANIATVIEGVFFYDLFNHLEHISYALAGIIFAVACRLL
ncbi:MAG: hypothetical protein KKB20_05760, partial [Proteobacteria bacterium]|nr:hypothetical protein [Pseudomonadota bacterium]